MKLLTFDRLYNFFVMQNQNFSFNDEKNPIVVQAPATFESQDSKDGQMFVHIKACHTELNRNKSFISEETMKNALSTIYNRPILAHIIELDDGTYDFHAHDMEFDEESGEVFYIERPIGHIPESGNAQLIYDEEADKTYVEVDGIIYEDYGNQASDIIRGKDSVKVSVELVINKLSYNAAEKYLEIEDFYFNGLTALGREENGKEIQEGMEGSKLTLKDFSLENNSLIEEAKEGKENTMTKFEELLQEYNIEATDIDFEYEGLSDEELTALFEEKFKVQETPDNKCTISVYGQTYNFELSMDERMDALYRLVNATYAEADNTYYYIKAFDTYVVMTDYCSNRIFKQNYTFVDNNCQLEGERVEVRVRYLTAEEESALDELNNKFNQISEDYSSVCEKYEDIQKQLDDVAKDTLIASNDYDSIRDSQEFESLVEKKADFTSDELAKELDSIILQFVKNNQIFSEKRQTSSLRVKTNIENEEKKPYGTLFDD